MVTAQSFNPANLDGTPASDAQMQALEQAIRYLNQDAEAAALLKQAADSGVSIKFYSEMSGEYIHAPHHYIKWNPEFSGGVRDGSDTGYLSPAMVLLHEIVHSVDKQPRISYIPFGGACPPKIQPCLETNNQYEIGMYNSLEKLAVETEQRIARRLGEPIRATYLDTIGDKTVPSPLHSSREYIRNGKLYQEESKGHAQEADGSVYTKVQTVSVNGVTESRNTSKFDEQFKKISQTVDTYDYTQGTITSTKTDYQNLDADGRPAVTRSITDLNGNPVQEQQQAQAAQIQQDKHVKDPIEALFLRMTDAALRGDQNTMMQAGRAYRESFAGQEWLQQGREHNQMQQAPLEQQQQEPQQQVQQPEVQRGPVMRM